MYNKICGRCGQKFRAKSYGKKYCAGCYEIVMGEIRKKMWAVRQKNLEKKQALTIPTKNEEEKKLETKQDDAALSKIEALLTRKIETAINQITQPIDTTITEADTNAEIWKKVHEIEQRLIKLEKEHETKEADQEAMPEDIPRWAPQQFRIPDDLEPIPKPTQKYPPLE